MMTPPAHNDEAGAVALPADLVFDGLRYSRVWEDAGTLVEGLRISPDDDVLSICSAGDNVLALALAGARSVVAFDVNPAQLALLHLHVAAIRTLDHDGYVRLIGARPCDDRTELYARAREALPPSAARFWDGEQATIESGIVDCGRLDRYFSTFQHEVIAALVDRATGAALFDFDDIGEQAAYFRRHLDTPELRDEVERYFGRDTMQSIGRDPAQFAYVEGGDIGAHFWRRFVAACTERSLRDDYYTRLLITAEYGDLAHGPPHLRPQHFESLRAATRRISVVESDVASIVASHPQATFSAANLSDVFEYLPEDTTEATLRLLGERLRRGARLAWWCLLVPRPVPAALVGDGVLVHDMERARRLGSAARCFFYRSFELACVPG